MEPFDKEGKFPARRKASLLEGGGTAVAVTEGVSRRAWKTGTDEKDTDAGIFWVRYDYGTTATSF